MLDTPQHDFFLELVQKLKEMEMYFNSIWKYGHRYTLVALQIGMSLDATPYHDVRQFLAGYEEWWDKEMDRCAELGITKLPTKFYGVDIELLEYMIETEANYRTFQRRLNNV